MENGGVNNCKGGSCTPSAVLAELMEAVDDATPSGVQCLSGLSECASEEDSVTPERRLEINIAALEKIAVKAEADRQWVTTFFNVDLDTSRPLLGADLEAIALEAQTFKRILSWDVQWASRPGHARYRLHFE